MHGQYVLTFNAGSSTLKIGVFQLKEGVERIGTVVVQLLHLPMTYVFELGVEEQRGTLIAAAADDKAELTTELFEVLSSRIAMSEVVAIGHRIVHGGDRFDAPVRLDAAALSAVEALVRLAPLHQPQSLRFIRAVGAHVPKIAQTASFDTSFHTTNKSIVRRFALPRELHDQGIKRYGFHGLSYAYIARKLPQVLADVENQKVVVAHLGSGCSLCGIIDGISKDTSMGFSTLDGVPMATRSGALDPGVLLHLLGTGSSVSELEELLYQQSGLLGVSGISGDSQKLAASDQPEAKEALDLFAFRIAGEACRIANTLGGLDVLVFTAGIGEHQPAIRAAVASHLGWLGLELDISANAAGDAIISSPSSRMIALLIRTDEEQIIADDAIDVLFSRTNHFNVNVPHCA